MENVQLDVASKKINLKDILEEVLVTSVYN